MLIDDAAADDAWAQALGRSIKVLRTDLGISRRQLAAQSAISYSYLSAIENGTKVPSAKILRVLADRLGLQTHELHAAAEARLARDQSVSDAATDSDDALIETQEQRFLERQQARLGLQPPAHNGNASELIALLPYLDTDDIAALIAVARRFTGQLGGNTPKP